MTVQGTMHIHMYMGVYSTYMYIHTEHHMYTLGMFIWSEYIAQSLHAQGGPRKM